MWWQSLPTFRSRKVFEVRPHSCSKSNPGCLLSVPPGSVLGTFSHIGKWDLDLSGNSGTMLQGLLGKVKFYAWWSNVMHAGGGGHPPLQPNSSFAWHSHPYMGSSHITRVSVFNLEHHNQQWQCVICRILHHSLWRNATCGGCPSWPTEVPCEGCVWHKTCCQSPVPMSRLARWSLQF